jgi:hypothetical protein
MSENKTALQRHAEAKAAMDLVTDAAQQHAKALLAAAREVWREELRARLGAPVHQAKQLVRISLLTSDPAQIVPLTEKLKDSKVWAILELENEFYVIVTE